MSDDTEKPAFVGRKPLDPDHFYLLYRSVLERDDPVAFYRDAVVVLGCGRLGLVPETLTHLHEGWIDWRDGTLTVPEREPCGCDRCVDRSTGMNGNRLSEGGEWRPPDDVTARTVPFGWSQRLTCVLLEFFDRRSHLELDGRPETRLSTLAERAPGLDPDSISVPVLRASAATTFADLGLDENRLRDVMGVDAAESVRRFVRLGSGFGSTDPLVPDDRFGSKYRIVGDATPFDGEFADPREYGATRRGTRARRNRSSSSRLTNPRGIRDGAEWNAESVVDSLDADSDLVSVQSGAVESFVHTWVARDDDRRETEPGPEPTAVETARSGTGESSRPQSPDLQTEASSDETPAQSDERADPTETENRDGDRDRAVSRVRLVGTPCSAAIDAPRETYAVEYVAPSLTAPSSVEGRLCLGDDRLALDVSRARADGTTFLVKLGAVSGFAFDYDPGAGVDFPGGIGLAVDWKGDTETVAVSFDRPRTAFASELLAALFQGREAIVSNPVKQGGRVNRDVDARRCRLRFGDGRLLATIPGREDPLLVVDLSSAAGVERTTQQYEGSEIPSIEVSFTIGRSAKTARIGFSNRRLARLFSQLSRVYYHRQRDRMREITLDEDEKEFLVSLHSMGAGGGLDFAQLLDLDGEEFVTFVADLERKGVVERTEDGTELTGLGRTVVNERIDDVNL